MIIIKKKKKKWTTNILYSYTSSSLPVGIRKQKYARHINVDNNDRKKELCDG